MYTLTNPFSSGPFKRYSKLLSKLVFSLPFRTPLGLLLLGLSILACQANNKTFESFDSSRWKAEEKECTGYRNTVITAMEDEFDKFIGMNETELIKYLGNPTKTLLYTRGQKFFSYEIDCKSAKNQPKQLRIRFSALDYVNEVLILD